MCVFGGTSKHRLCLCHNNGWYKCCGQIENEPMLAVRSRIYHNRKELVVRSKIHCNLTSFIEKDLNDSSSASIEHLNSSCSRISLDLILQTTSQHDYVISWSFVTTPTTITPNPTHIPIPWKKRRPTLGWGHQASEARFP